MDSTLNMKSYINSHQNINIMNQKIHLIKAVMCVGFCIFTSSVSKAQSTINSLTSTVSISTLNTQLYESWPTPATVVIRRTGDLRAVTIPINITGTATTGIDYRSTVGTSVTIPMGKKEVWIQFVPLNDVLNETDETISIQLQPSPAYTIVEANPLVLVILDKGLGLDDNQASRFLIQAGFGADPDELAKVKQLGFSAWIDQQITRPKGYALTRIRERKLQVQSLYHHDAQPAVWKNIMRRTPAGQNDTTDILRQRVAYSLMQLFVVSQTMDAIMGHPEGLTNYYDYLVDGAFGNFRTMLGKVTYSPYMGLYLSHLGNRKPNPINNTFPDQNYAREVMQLFTIGLWELNLDGTRKLQNGLPIPTYTDTDIATFARVFTGLTWADAQWYGDGETKNAYLDPMRTFDEIHDMDSKQLLRGVTLPAGQTTNKDVNDALDNLFNHPNVGPFIANFLIQRLITSNPSPAYIARVATKFNNDGAGVRGNMGAVVKAILMDIEARDFNKTQEATFGKMREPYMTLINMAKTFNAQSQSGVADVSYMYEFYLQEIFRAPSVFNFYLPAYRAPGQVTASGKYSPEFQILTAVTAIETQNNLRNCIEREISRWGADNQIDKMIMKFDEEIPLAGNPDALIRLLSRKMTGSTLSPKSFEIIKDAVVKIPTTDNEWQLQRVKLAAYLTGSSAEFNIQK